MKKTIKTSIIVLLLFAVSSYVAFCVTHITMYLTQTIVGAALAGYIHHIKYSITK